MLRQSRPPRDAALGPRVTMGPTVLLGYVAPAVPVWLGIVAVGGLRRVARLARRRAAG